jgi:hypothetical protein
MRYRGREFRRSALALRDARSGRLAYLSGNADRQFGDIGWSLCLPD